jgi:ferredoxin-NADP reductase
MRAMNKVISLRSEAMTVTATVETMMPDQVVLALQDAGVVGRGMAADVTGMAAVPTAVADLCDAHLGSRVTQAGFWDRLPTRWDSDSDDVLICSQVRCETLDVKTFVFRAPEARAFVFEPGQFITVELDIDGECVNRCYTISSSPTRPHMLAITVKRVAGGIVSNWLHDNLIAGGTVRALGPAGAFTCARHPARKFLFLSAGSGITPLMAMSRTHYDLGEDRDIVFLHSARTPDDIIFERELALMAADQANFRTAFVCERRGARQAWHGVTGYLNLPLLKLITPDYLEREIFVCGPAPYMAAVRALLDEGGFDRKQYHEESFSFDTIAEVAAQLATAHVGDALADTPNTADVAASVETRFKVSFAKSRRDIDCASDQNVLDAAKKAGGASLLSPWRFPSISVYRHLIYCPFQVLQRERNHR